MATVPSPAARRPSFPSQSSSSVLASSDRPLPPRTLLGTLTRHGKYIVAGGWATWYYDTWGHVLQVLTSEKAWLRRTMTMALGLHGLSIAIFLYFLFFLPRIRGYVPDYGQWQKSGRLRYLIPTLTAILFTGWSSYIIAFSQAGTVASSGREAFKEVVQDVGEAQWGAIAGKRGMGVWGAFVAATGLYVLTIGTLGLVPVPQNLPVDKKRA